MVYQSFTTSSSIKISHKLLRLLLLIFFSSAILATCLLIVLNGLKQASDLPNSQTDTATLTPTDSESLALMLGKTKGGRRRGQGRMR